MPGTSRGERFQQELRPFVWRRHLDFAAIQDAHDMRVRIKDHKGLHGGLDLPGFDMKQGTGGIRAIEFFAQFHQIVAGGRDPDLRVRGTVPALALLAQKGWIPADMAEKLTAAYRAHREVEHRVQMVNDAQTHALPTTEEGFARLACFMDRDAAELKAEVRGRLEEVRDLTDGFFAREGFETPAEDPAAPQITFDEAIVARWRGYPALRSERARAIFERLRPEMLKRLARAAKPDEALVAFDHFLSGLPAGVQLFSLFEANPQLIDLLGDIVGTAPELAAYLSRNAGVFDAVIGGDFFAKWPGLDTLCNDLDTTLQTEADYERKLDAARRWQKDWHFRIGVHHLRGLIDAKAAGAEYAELAEAVLRCLFPVVATEFARKHGDLPGRGAVVLGMGSLGAGRLNARSDLDQIVIYDAGTAEASDGRRPLDVRTYYARLTQALVTALTAPMSEGRLYEADMRLRPSGNQGPVATSWPSFRDYQADQAWVWEHLAMTRARVVAAVGAEGAALGDDVTAFRDKLQARGRDRDEILSAVAEMRSRIAQARTPDAWEVKTGPGRNQEIELIAQAGALIGGVPSGPLVTGLDGAVDCGWLSVGDRADLLAAYDLCWQLGQVAKLLSDRPLDPDAIGEGGREMLLRETGASDIAALEARYEEATGRAAAVIDRALAGYEEESG
ncbi:glutamine-synthetase adenylyltransferase [Pseudooceanicola sp. LIPI14-2-Ac024]|uniref:[protein-PII] uridylyltransferase family protein n=1 Tax=Pseudooceanicola sp. LIPI14-2-Ac024 TaxID=3344875 RepID=UPI0035D01D95